MSLSAGWRSSRSLAALEHSSELAKQHAERHQRNRQSAHAVKGSPRARRVPDRPPRPLDVAMSAESRCSMVGGSESRRDSWLADGWLSVRSRAEVVRVGTIDRLTPNGAVAGIANYHGREGR